MKQYVTLISEYDNISRPEGLIIGFMKNHYKVRWLDDGQDTTENKEHLIYLNVNGQDMDHKQYKNRRV